eukprot:780295-Pyramimonas_sp.AAC.1
MAWIRLVWISQRVSLGDLSPLMYWGPGWPLTRGMMNSLHLPQHFRARARERARSGAAAPPSIWTSKRRFGAPAPAICRASKMTAAASNRGASA